MNKFFSIFKKSLSLIFLILFYFYGLYPFIPYITELFGFENAIPNFTEVNTSPSSNPDLHNSNNTAVAESVLNNTETDTPATPDTQDTPFYKKTVFWVGVGIVTLVLIGGVYFYFSGGGPDCPSPIPAPIEAPTPLGPPTPPSPVIVGPATIEPEPVAIEMETNLEAGFEQYTKEVREITADYIDQTHENLVELAQVKDLQAKYDTPYSQSASALKYSWLDKKEDVINEVNTGISPIPESNNVLPIEESKDHVALEQHLLNNYQLELNLNRNASGKRKLSLSLPPHLSDTDDHSTKVGPLNPQFGKTGITSPVWDHKHSEEQRVLWSKMRSTTIFIYSASTLTFECLVIGLKSLSSFLGVHVNTARRVLRSGSVYDGKWIITPTELSNAQLSAIKLSKTSETGKHERHIAKSVYIYRADKSLLLAVFSSVNAFMKFSGVNGSDIRKYCLSSTLLWRGLYFFILYFNKICR